MRATGRIELQHQLGQLDGVRQLERNDTRGLPGVVAGVVGTLVMLDQKAFAASSEAVDERAIG